MERLLFSRDLLTGDDVVDGHHRALFAAANEVLFAADVRANPNTFLRALSFLARYARFHFAAEEAAMARWHYEAVDKHREHHAALSREIDALWQVAAEDGPTPRLTQGLYRLMDDWIRYHVRVLDKDFVQHVARVRAAEDTREALWVEDERAAGEFEEVARGGDPTDEGGLLTRIRKFWT